MNEDSTQENLHNIVQRDLALADAQLPDDETTTDMSVPQPETSPADAIVPTKLWRSNDVYVQHFYTMSQIDVTDGNWHDLYIANGTYLPPSGPVTIESISQLTQLTLGDLMGLPIGNIYGSQWTSNNRESRSSNQLNKYTWGKLNNVSVQLGNFSVTIERDASGGIQFKDEPLFEVTFTPNLSVHFETEDGSLMPTSGYTTNLKEGINFYGSISSSWYLLDELSMKYVDPKGGNKVVWYYPNLAEFLTHQYRNGVEVGFSMPPRAWINEPLYTCYIRMINVPRGISNIKVYLAYTSHMKAHWSAAAFQEDSHGSFPLPGTAVPTALRYVPPVIIRQIHPIDPMAMYQSVEDGKIEFSTFQSKHINRWKDGKRYKKMYLRSS